jgi:hypothetical protein
MFSSLKWDVRKLSNDFRACWLTGFIKMKVNIYYWGTR